LLTETIPKKNRPNRRGQFTTAAPLYTHSFDGDSNLDGRTTIADDDEITSGLWFVGFLRNSLRVGGWLIIGALGYG
jgi:hypothetical protein